MGEILKDFKGRGCTNTFTVEDENIPKSGRTYVCVLCRSPKKMNERVPVRNEGGENEYACELRIL